MPVEDLNTKSAFRPCLIIPIYNHAEEFARVLPSLRALGVATLLLDDGSDENHWQTLQQTVHKESWIQLIRSPVNTGKGATVCRGLMEAAKQGFSHGLQVDSDGQHRIEDIPRFLRASQQNPQAVVTAIRIYENAPRNRVYGRKLTDFWVWVNTLSLHIQDSMCGFRSYPLQATLSQLNLAKVRRRMDFDTDILVKLYWQGVPIRQIETSVRYDEEIASHFDLWADNVRISLMHTHLFFGMLLRIPSLLKLRKNYSNKRLAVVNES